MAAGVPTLYGYWRSSAAYRIRIALNLKGIPYSLTSVDLKHGKQFEETYQRINPYARVPTLLIDGLTLCQSGSILEYLEETRPSPPLLPADAAGRQKVREIVQAVACDIQPVQNLRVTLRLGEICRQFTDEATVKQTVAKWQHDWIRRGLAALERTLAATSGSYCCGNQVTMADVVLAPQVYNAHRYAVDTAALFPVIHKVYKNLMQLEAFQKANPDIQPDATL
eukprot:GHVT01033251.1.p2 GENE.GHVT01033251.1~~GHVT01033251.1.p2  ORF type:complete len:224 (+),score=50.86 GHVT01033251.1:833-1504(+)